MLILNDLSSLTVERIPDTKEAEVPTIYIIPDETVDLYKWYYHGVYMLLKLKKIIVLVERRSRQRWRNINMRTIWRKWCLMMNLVVTGGCFLRIMREGDIIRNICYMIIGGMFTSVL